jgi:hypothetical protein
MQVQIIFTASGSSSATGNFAPGDVLRCSAEQARHFVVDAKCARYAEAPAQSEPEGEPVKTTKRKSAKDQA